MEKSLVKRFGIEFVALPDRKAGLIFPSIEPKMKMKQLEHG